jgi:hypothetical protein
MTQRRQNKVRSQKAESVRSAKNGDSSAEERRRAYLRQLDERLDEALKETFPASDPIALTPRPRRRA